MKKIYSGFILILFLAFNLAISHTTFAQLSPVMNPIQGPTAICSVPAAPVFTASASNSPTSYSWSVAGSYTGVMIGNSTGAITSISFPHVPVNATYTVYCYATNNGGSSPIVSYIVTVYETPTVTFSGATSFCQGSSTNISASPTTFQASSTTLSYSWSPSTGLNTTTGPTVHAQPASTTNYTVLLTMGTCTNTALLSIVVNTCVVGIGTITTPETDLLIYPNPSTDSFILKSAKDELAVILNEIGQTVRSFKLIAGSETKVSGLPGGIYFVITSTSRKKISVTN